MRKFLSVLFFFSILVVKSQPLDYYLPKNVNYNPAIPTPKSIIYHEVGEWHVTHDRLVNYMMALDAASDRISSKIIGYTYEGRPQLSLIITSPANHARLEEIRTAHVQLTDADKSANLNIDNMPTVVWQGFSIHGNESSGSNAALLTAYYLAAAQGPAIDDLLNNVVIVFDPSFNPDGLNRFANWANMHKSKTLVTDPQSREFSEVWPGGRFNHYWFDLNRDWLPAQHVESQNRLQVFHSWKPNILTDHHEMGSGSTFFFQPGVPSRVNPNTPLKNQELTGAIGNYHAKFLDSIGSMYFTKEGYDDFYYGKGSTYPDINGGVGILFEQASSRGHAQETENGILSFPFTIRNQFVASLSTLEAAKSLRKQLLTYQRDFFKETAKEAESFAVKGYVIDRAKMDGKYLEFVKMLSRHHIAIKPLTSDCTIDGKTFKAGEADIVPTNQQQFKIIKTIFEKTFDYKDSLFYDVTAWTMPLAFGLNYAEVKTDIAPFINGKTMADANKTSADKIAPSTVGYAINWNDYYAPKLVLNLQKKGINVKVATQKFTAETNEGKTSFSYGTIIIPVQSNGNNPARLNQMLNDHDASDMTYQNIQPLKTGLSAAGIDFGSGSMLPVKIPKVMMFGGNGTSATDVGEIWHLLDQRFNLPVSIVDVDRFGAINPSRYNVIIMVSGTYPGLDKDKLRSWVAAGGTLIATEDATKWLSTNGITKTLFRSADDKKDSTLNLPYYLRSDEQRAKDMAGSLFEAKMDLTHPLCYGYTQPTVSIFKSNTLFMDQNNDPYDSPVMYTDNPLQSGYLYRGYKEKIKNTAAINIESVGRGKVISMVDNLNFRAFWLGTSKMFMNAIYFGDLIRL